MKTGSTVSNPWESRTRPNRRISMGLSETWKYLGMAAGQSGAGMKRDCISRPDSGAFIPLCLRLRWIEDSAFIRFKALGGRLFLLPQKPLSGDDTEFVPENFVKIGSGMAAGFCTYGFQ